ncbi:hypothetical protein [Streptomyces sp. NPDC058625]|uniref:hypothetical protein n=1 Tax=Streptomyces sp. NPDC058625 TaxID=3346564 RepID=UPI00364CF7A5
MKAVLAGFANVAPLQDLDRAWRWSPVPALRFAGALTEDGTRLLQTDQRGKHDEELARAVLSLTREHGTGLIGAGPPIAARINTTYGAREVGALDAVAPRVLVVVLRRTQDLLALRRSGAGDHRGGAGEEHGRVGRGTPTPG